MKPVSVSVALAIVIALIGPASTATAFTPPPAEQPQGITPLPAEEHPPRPSQGPETPPLQSQTPSEQAATPAADPDATVAAQVRYTDVSADGTHYPAITALADLGIFDGTDCGQNRFCPTDPLPRWAIAVWLVRILDGDDPTPRSARFADVTGNPWWESHVERLAELGVTAGCATNPLRFCPDRTVSRAQMASFLARAFDLPSGPDAGFTDVTAGSTHSDDISALYASGMTAGCRTEPLRYCPARATTRGEMATFLWRAVQQVSEPTAIRAYDDVIEVAPQLLSSQGSQKSFEIEVYYCGTNSNYDLSRDVTEFNAVINGFFQREAGIDPTTGEYRTSIEFKQGKNGSKITNLDWGTDTATDWANNKHNDPCRPEASSRAGHDRVLVLADISPGPRVVWGWAPKTLNGERILVVTHNNITRTDGYEPRQIFLQSVAHEIGHAFYNWHHPFKEYGGVDLTDEMKQSVMSYLDYGAKLDLTEDAHESHKAYVACYQRQDRMWVAEDVGTDECKRRPRAPNAPYITSVTPGDGLLVLDWEESNDGDLPILRYDVWYKPSALPFDVDNWFTVTSRHTPFTIVGLTNGTSYQVAVRAVNSIGESDWSSVIERTPSRQGQDPDRMPVEEVILTVGASALGQEGADGACTSVHCRWLHVEIVGEGQHTLVCAHNGAGGFSRGAYQNTVVSDWPSTGNCLFGYPGREVFVIVGAELRDGSWHGGIYSNTVIWPDCTVEPDRSNPDRCPGTTAGDADEVPDRPTVRATVSGTTVEASWSADDNNSRIERWQLQGPDDVDFRLNPDITNYTWRNLSSGRYRLRVRAQNSDGWSQWGETTVTVGDPELSVRRGSVKIDDGSCPASAGCRWVIGVGSGWPAGEQFWIKCGSFVDTSRDHPVPYHDRFVDSQGNLTSWGEQICYSAGRHTVEVWTESGVRKTATIPATESPGPSPTLSVRRGSVKIDDGSCPASAGCRWVIGVGSGWPAGEQFWIKCGSFVDTSRDHPVPYHDRFVDSQGNLTSWGEQICYSAGRHTVEVWTESGVRKTATIPAT